MRKKTTAQKIAQGDTRQRGREELAEEIARQPKTSMASNPRQIFRATQQTSSGFSPSNWN